LRIGTKGERNAVHARTLGFDTRVAGRQGIASEVAENVICSVAPALIVVKASCWPPHGDGGAAREGQVSKFASVKAGGGQVAAVGQNQNIGAAAAVGHRAGKVAGIGDGERIVGAAEAEGGRKLGAGRSC